MKTLFIILIVGITSFVFTDLESDNAFYGIFLPFVDFLSLLALAIWFVMLFHKYKINQTTGRQGNESSGFIDFDAGGE